ncbi:MAG TPA: ATP-binding cassette domain-containing protein [Methylophaga sp.]|nr:ATP-binding cassette domain-containing protein [Methylophaga sp.]HEC58220.1 ATP-binding cassette domain-containing protein [Methylophaga sp.]
MSSSIITVKNVVTQFGPNRVHDGVSLHVKQGEIYGLLGGSGSGKSTLLKEMIMLLTPKEGDITILGQNILTSSNEDKDCLRRQWGVLFQNGALFSSLTVAENVAIGLKEYTELPAALIDDIVRMKISMVGLPPHVGLLYPAELSGGMIKRASLARALSMDPKLLFLDEPTSGLDPVGAAAFDELILKLRDMLELTIVMVTHDLDSIWTTVDRLAVLGEKKVIVEGTLDDVNQSEHPDVKAFFRGKRGLARIQNGK